MADGAQILSYNLNSLNISADELEKINQMRNIDFNNRVETKFETMIDEVNAEYCKSTKNEIQNQCISYLSEEDQSYYYQHKNSWSNEETLSFWNSHQETVVEQMKNSGIGQEQISSFQSNLTNWATTVEIDSRQDSIRQELSNTQSQIHSLETQLQSYGINPEAKNIHDYDLSSEQLDLLNQYNYQKSQEHQYQSELKQTITSYGFHSKQEMQYVADMLAENNIPCATTNKVNGQYVILVNQTFQSDVQRLASEHEDMNLTAYKQKWVSSTYSDTNEDGSLQYQDKSDRDIGADFAYATVVNPALSMGMREVSQGVYYVNLVKDTLETWSDPHKTAAKDIFSHHSNHDVAYEQNFHILENQNARMEFIEKKFGVSREDLFDQNKPEMIQSDDATAIQSIAKNKFELNELQNFMKDKETLDILSEKYGISFGIVKQENTISNVTDGTKFGINKSSMTEFSLALNDANAKLLDKLQGKLVLDGKSMIVNGRLDLAMLKRSGLTAKDLGISEKEFKFLQDMAGHDPSFGAKMIGSGASLLTGMMRNVQKYSDSDYSWLQDIQKGTNIGKKVFEGTKKTVKFVKDSDFSAARLKLKSKKKPSVKKRKKALNTSKKKIEKAKSSLKSQSAHIEKARQTEAKRLLAKQKWEKSALGKIAKAKEYFATKTAVGKAAQAITKAFSAAMKFVAKWAVIAALFVTAILTVIVIIAMIFFAIVPGFMEEPETEDTAMYKLYEHLMAMEDDWIEGLKDTDSYYKNKEDLAYGDNWQFWTKINGKNQYYNYVDAKVANARSEKGLFGGYEVYINPFDFKPAKSIENDVEHKVSAFDGGVNVEIISNFNISMETDAEGKIILCDDHWKHGGGHTCNVKDILCMLDVMLGFETTGSWDDQSLSDSKAQLEFKDGWKNVKHGAKLIGYGIGSAFGSDDAFGAWAEEQEAGSGSVGYYAMEGYTTGLFNMSHQEKFNLEVVKFPVVTDLNAKITKADMQSEGDGFQMAYNDIITACPGDKKDGLVIDDDGNGHMIHACQHYDDFKPFFYDKNADVSVPYNIPLQFVKGIEGDDGKMHPVKNEVYFEDEDEMCIDARVTQTDLNNGTAWSLIWNDYKDNDHWEYKEGKDETVIDGVFIDEMSADEKNTWDKYSNGQSVYTVSRDFSNNSKSQWVTITKTTYSKSSKKEQTKRGTKKQWFDEEGHYDYDHPHYEDANGNPVAEPWYDWKVDREAGYYDVDNIVEVEKCTLTRKSSTLRWQEDETCKGHKGYYCGGHFRCNVTGVVYSMKNDDVNYVLGTMEETKAETYYIECPVGTYQDANGNTLGVPVDYSTIEQAHKTGLNVNFDWDMWAPNYFTVFDSVWAYRNHYPGYKKNGKKKEIETKADIGELLGVARLWEDIFTVDNDVDYGKMQFTYADYRQYEGWNEDNKTIALTKYGQDWKEIYGFDIPTEIGFGEVDYADIQAVDMALAEKYGADYGPVRQHVVNLALAACGNGEYDSDAHHWHAYTAFKHGSVTCTKTDCSGFASYPLIQTERDLGIKLNTPYKSKFAYSCSELAGFTNEQGSTVSMHDQSPYKAGTYVVASDYSNCKPGDIISKKTGAGEGGSDPNHSVVFIGVLDEEVTLPSGKVIKEGKPMIVDCTTLSGNGNIYFRGYNNDTSKTGGYAPWAILYDWGNKYKAGNRSLWVRDITYGTELQ